MRQKSVSRRMFFTTCVAGLSPARRMHMRPRLIGLDARRSSALFDAVIRNFRKLCRLLQLCGSCDRFVGELCPLELVPRRPVMPQPGGGVMVLTSSAPHGPRSAT